MSSCPQYVDLLRVLVRFVSDADIRFSAAQVQVMR